jgi:glutamate racemase
MWSPHSPVAIVLGCNTSASVLAGELKMPLLYEFTFIGVITAVGSLYLYINKQLTASKQEIT